MDVVERVAEIIREATEGQECYVAGVEDTARAAIAAVLDSMAEPSEGAKSVFVDRALTVALSGEYTWPDYARDQWQAMLSAMRAEMLEATGPATPPSTEPTHSRT